MLAKDKEARRLSKVKISIMRNPKFALWSGLMTVGKTTVDDDMPTACTNGRDETYGREFIKSLEASTKGTISAGTSPNRLPRSATKICAFSSP